jgi:uncharacterized phiE125 gp8 family phage protein
MTANWTLIRTTSPSSLPVTVAQAKSHLNLNPDDTTHNDKLQLLIEAATERLEQDLDRQILTATYKQTQFDWNVDDALKGELKLYKKAVTVIQSVKYYNEDGTLVTMSSSDYIFDTGRCSLFVQPGKEWPTVETDNPNAVEVTFTAGYGTDAACVPRMMKTAILLCVGKWFYDPAQEGSALHSQEVAYERLVSTLMRSSYP